MNEPGTQVSIPEVNPPSLLQRMAGRYGVESNKMLTTLKSTAFKGDVSNEQMMALLIVAEQHGLNPWTKEIYAFPDRQNGIVPVVGVDGWSRIINEHPQFDGMSFEETEESCTCTIYRKDRKHPTSITEYMSECKRSTSPWGSHPRRMLRHKAMIQCSRLAFGFAGIYDQDEAERIVDVSPSRPADEPATDLNEDLGIEDGEIVSETVTADDPEPEPEPEPRGPAVDELIADMKKAKSKGRLQALGVKAQGLPAGPEKEEALEFYYARNREMIEAEKD